MQLQKIINALWPLVILLLLTAVFLSFSHSISSAAFTEIEVAQNRSDLNLNITGGWIAQQAEQANILLGEQ